jgi:hypothetical protein
MFAVVPHAEDSAMRTFCLTLLTLAALLACAHQAPGQTPSDLLPPDKPIPEVVDHYIDAALKEAGIAPAPQADDATLVRRLTLDLVGRIPTAAEVQAYVSSTAPDKRAELVDRLMASPGFQRHQVNEFDAMLMAGTRSSLRDYLTLAFKEDRSWAVIFRELIRADETNPKTRGSSNFLKAHVKDLDRLTNEVSVLFFGVNVSCAQCHDHPLVHDWKQDHFYGMKSFFNRTFEAGGQIAERDKGIVQFKTTKGVSKNAQLMFLTGTVVVDPEGGSVPVEVTKPQPKKISKAPIAPVPPPKFSVRNQLAELALQPKERDFFARSIVNRVWHRLYGTGLVSPLDQMHSENAPSHPELLAWLARDTAEHGYDLRRLIRELVLSKTWSRSSRWEGSSFPRPQTFAVARLRALTPMQLATSLRLATTASDQLPATLKPDELERRLEGLESGARGFASLIEQPRDDFQISVTEALLFSNSDRIQKEFLTDGRDRLLGQLKEIKDTNAALETLTLNVLGRSPTGEEKALLTEYLNNRKDRPAEALRQVTWALLTGAEFRFNH